MKASHIKLSLKPADNDILKKELAKLGPRLSAKSVVNAAKKASSPLHKFFEWDDKKCGHAWRLHQARNLILSVHIETDNGSIRAYENVVIDDTRAYVPIEEIAASPILVEQVLQTALRELLYWKSKHRGHEVFFGSVFKAISETELKLRRKNEKANKGTSAGRGAERARI